MTNPLLDELQESKKKSDETNSRRSNDSNGNSNKDTTKPVVADQQKLLEPFLQSAMTTGGKNGNGTSAKPEQSIKSEQKEQISKTTPLGTNDRDQSLRLSGTLVCRDSGFLRSYSVEAGKVIDSKGNTIGSFDDKTLIAKIHGKEITIGEAEDSAFHGIRSDSSKLNLLPHNGDKQLNGILSNGDNTEAINVTGGHLYDSKNKFLGILNDDGSVELPSNENTTGYRPINSLFNRFQFKGELNGKEREFFTSSDNTTGKILLPTENGNRRECNVSMGMIIDKATGKQIGFIKPPDLNAVGKLEGGLVYLKEGDNLKVLPLASLRGASFDLMPLGQTGVIGDTVKGKLQGVCLGAETMADGRIRSDQGILNLNQALVSEGKLQRQFETELKDTKDSDWLISPSHISGTNEAKLNELSARMQLSSRRANEFKRCLSSSRLTEADLAHIKQNITDANFQSASSALAFRKQKLDSTESILEKLPIDQNNPEKIKPITGTVKVPNETGQLVNWSVKDSTIYSSDGNTIGTIKPNGLIELAGSTKENPKLTEMKALTGAIWDLQYTDDAGKAQRLQWASLGDHIVSRANLSNEVYQEHLYAYEVDKVGKSENSRLIYDATSARRKQFEHKIANIFEHGIKGQEDLKLLTNGGRAIRLEVVQSTGETKPEIKSEPIDIPKLDEKIAQTVNGKLRIGNDIYQIRNGDLFKYQSGSNNTESIACGKLKAGYDVEIKGQGEFSLASENRVLLDMTMADGDRHQLIGLGRGHMTDNFGYVSGGLLDVQELQRQCDEHYKQAIAGNKEYFDKRPYLTGGLASSLMEGRDEQLKEFAHNIRRNSERLQETIYEDESITNDRGRENNSLFVRGFKPGVLDNTQVDTSIMLAQSLLNATGAQAADTNYLAQQGTQVQRQVNDGVVMMAMTVATAGIGTGFSALANAQKIANLGRMGQVMLYAGELGTSATAGGFISSVGRASNDSTFSNNFKAGAFEGGTMALGSLGGKFIGNSATVKEARGLLKAYKSGAQLTPQQAKLASVLSKSLTGRMINAGASDASIYAMRLTGRVLESAGSATGFHLAGQAREGQKLQLDPQSIATGTTFMLAGHTIASGIGRYLNTPIIKALVNSTTNNLTYGTLDALSPTLQNQDLETAARLGISVDMLSEETKQANRDLGKAIPEAMKTGAIAALTNLPGTLALHGISSVAHTIKQRIHKAQQAARDTAATANTVLTTAQINQQGINIENTVEFTQPNTSSSLGSEPNTSDFGQSTILVGIDQPQSDRQVQISRGHAESSPAITVPGNKQLSNHSVGQPDVQIADKHNTGPSSSETNNRAFRADNGHDTLNGPHKIPELPELIYSSSSNTPDTSRTSAKSNLTTPSKPNSSTEQLPSTSTKEIRVDEGKGIFKGPHDPPRSASQAVVARTEGSKPRETAELGSGSNRSKLAMNSEGEANQPAPKEGVKSEEVGPLRNDIAGSDHIDSSEHMRATQPPSSLDKIEAPSLTNATHDIRFNEAIENAIESIQTTDYKGQPVLTKFQGNEIDVGPAMRQYYKLREVCKPIENNFVIPYAKEVAKKLGINPELINDQTVKMSEGLGTNLGSYSSQVFELTLSLKTDTRIMTADLARKTIEHELRHMKRALRCTAAYRASPTEFQSIIRKQWLAEIGTSSGRRFYNDYEKRPILSEKSRQQLQGLLEAALPELDPEHLTRSNINSWLDGKKIPKALSRELKDRNTLAHEVLAELRVYRAMVNNSIIPEDVVNHNPQLHKFIEQNAKQFRNWQDNGKRQLTDNPEFLRLTQNMSWEATAMVGPNEYQFSPDENQAYRFAYTREIARLLSLQKAGIELTDVQQNELRHAKAHIKVTALQEALIRSYGQFMVTDGKIANEHLAKAKAQARTFLGIANINGKISQEIFKYLYDLNLLNDSELIARGLPKNQAGHVIFPLLETARPSQEEPAPQAPKPTETSFTTLHTTIAHGIDSLINRIRQRSLERQITAGYETVKIGYIPADALWQADTIEKQLNNRSQLPTNTTPFVDESLIKPFCEKLQSRLQEVNEHVGIGVSRQRLNELETKMQQLTLESEDQMEKQTDITQAKQALNREQAAKIAESMLTSNTEWLSRQQELSRLKREFDSNTQPLESILLPLKDSFEQLNMPEILCHFLSTPGKNFSGAYAPGNGEIYLNTTHLLSKSPEIFAETLIAEMVHAEQDHLIVRAIADQVLGNKDLAQDNARREKQIASIQTLYGDQTRLSLNPEWLLKVLERRSHMDNRKLSTEQVKRANLLMGAASIYQPYDQNFLSHEFSIAEIYLNGIRRNEVHSSPELMSKTFSNPEYMLKTLINPNKSSSLSQELFGSPEPPIAIQKIMSDYKKWQDQKIAGQDPERTQWWNEANRSVLFETLGKRLKDINLQRVDHAKRHYLNPLEKESHIASHLAGSLFAQLPPSKRTNIDNLPPIAGGAPNREEEQARGTLSHSNTAGEQQSAITPPDPKDRPIRYMRPLSPDEEPVFQPITVVESTSSSDTQSTIEKHKEKLQGQTKQLAERRYLLRASLPPGTEDSPKIVAINKQIIKNIEQRMSLIPKQLDQFYNQWNKQMDLYRGSLLKLSRQRQAAQTKSQEMEIIKQRDEFDDDMTKKADQLTITLNKDYRILQIALEAENGRLASTGRMRREDVVSQQQAAEYERSEIYGPYLYRNPSSHAHDVKFHVNAYGGLPYKDIFTVLDIVGKLPRGTNTLFRFNDYIHNQGEYDPADGSINIQLSRDSFRTTKEYLERVARHEVGHAVHEEIFEPLAQVHKQHVFDAYHEWLNNQETADKLGETVLSKYGQQLVDRKSIDPERNYSAYCAAFPEIVAEMMALYEFSKTCTDKQLTYTQLLAAVTAETNAERAKIMGNAEAVYNILKREVFEPYDRGSNANRDLKDSEITITSPPESIEERNGKKDNRTNPIVPPDPKDHPIRYMRPLNADEEPTDRLLLPVGETEFARELEVLDQLIIRGENIWGTDGSKALVEDFKRFALNTKSLEHAAYAIDELAVNRPENWEEILHELAVSDSYAVWPAKFELCKLSSKAEDYRRLFLEDGQTARLWQEGKLDAHNFMLGLHSTAQKGLLSNDDMNLAIEQTMKVIEPHPEQKIELCIMLAEKEDSPNPAADWLFTDIKDNLRAEALKYLLEQKSADLETVLNHSINHPDLTPILDGIVDHPVSNGPRVNELVAREMSKIWMKESQRVSQEQNVNELLLADRVQKFVEQISDLRWTDNKDARDLYTQWEKAKKLAKIKDKSISDPARVEATKLRTELDEIMKEREKLLNGHMQKVAQNMNIVGTVVNIFQSKTAAGDYTFGTGSININEMLVLDEKCMPGLLNTLTHERGHQDQNEIVILYFADKLNIKANPDNTINDGERAKLIQECQTALGTMHSKRNVSNSFVDAVLVAGKERQLTVGDRVRAEALIKSFQAYEKTFKPIDKLKIVYEQIPENTRAGQADVLDQQKAVANYINDDLGKRATERKATAIRILGVAELSINLTEALTELEQAETHDSPDLETYQKSLIDAWRGAIDQRIIELIESQHYSSDYRDSLHEKECAEIGRRARFFANLLENQDNLTTDGQSHQPKQSQDRKTADSDNDDFLP